MKILFSISILFFLNVSAYAKPIRLEDFNWGMTLLEVEAHAAEKNYTLAEKEITGIKPHLEYETHLHGHECGIMFFFTPLGQKLYSAIVTWDPSTYGSLIKSILMKEYKYPREEIPAANRYIWTRTNTEMELRYGFGNTTLTYSNLDLWNEFKDEKDLIEEREEEEEEEVP
jgi:hypothetical protein